MADFKLIWDINAGDLAIENADIALDGTLRSAILVSLFTDARVDEDELPAGETDRRGWWGQDVQDDPDDNIGSKLWLLRRSKITTDILTRARTYAGEALAWMISDKVATEVDVETEFVQDDVMLISIVVTLPDQETEEFEFAI